MNNSVFLNCFNKYFRSTLYGNFIRKICQKAGHDVHSINYLGDWGTQFATLALYWKIIGNEGTRITSEKWAELTSKQKVELLTTTYAKATAHFKYNEALKVSFYIIMPKLF